MRVENKEGFGQVVILSGPDVEAICAGSYTEEKGITVKADFNQSENIAAEKEKERKTVTIGSLGQGMTPNDLEILIHFYVSPASHPRAGAPAVDQSCTRMVSLGIMEISPDFKYSITSKGKAWMRCILDTPFPKQVWLDDNGHIIDINE